MNKVLEDLLTKQYLLKQELKEISKEIKQIQEVDAAQLKLNLRVIKQPPVKAAS